MLKRRLPVPVHGDDPHPDAFDKTTFEHMAQGDGIAAAIRQGYVIDPSCGNTLGAVSPPRGGSDMLWDAGAGTCSGAARDLGLNAAIDDAARQGDGALFWTSSEAMPDMFYFFDMHSQSFHLSVLLVKDSLQ